MTIMNVHWHDDHIPIMGIWSPNGSLQYHDIVRWELNQRPGLVYWLMIIYPLVVEQGKPPSINWPVWKGQLCILIMKWLQIMNIHPYHILDDSGRCHRFWSIPSFFANLGNWHEYSNFFNMFSLQPPMFGVIGFLFNQILRGNSGFCLVENGHVVYMLSRWIKQCLTPSLAHDNPPAWVLLHPPEHIRQIGDPRSFAPELPNPGRLRSCRPVLVYTVGIPLFLHYYHPQF